MKVKYPKLNFILDKEFDQWTCKEFLTYDPNDSFSNDILLVHPDLETGRGLTENEKLLFFKNYIDKYYMRYEHVMQSRLLKAQTAWKQVDVKFYKLVENIFSSKKDGGVINPYLWPDENYVCAISIFNCNPIRIKRKCFQVFFLHPYGIVPASIHEMLHFAFYDYIERTHKEIFTKLGGNGMWKLSEIFNDIILRTPDFINLTNVKEPEIYAQSEDELKKYLLTWKESQNIDDFLKKYLE